MNGGKVSKQKMNKKASLVLTVLGELLAVVLVMFVMTDRAAAMGKSEVVFRINLANDLEMMLNTLVNLPGEAVVEYPKNVSLFTITLNQRKTSEMTELVIFKRGADSKKTEESKKEFRTFYLPTAYSASGSLEGKERLCLEKREQWIELRECRKEEGIIPTELSALTSPSTATSTAKSPSPVSSTQISAEIQKKFESGFLEKVKQTAAELGTNYQYLLAIMHFETKGTFKPNKYNEAGSGAVGLIQFTSIAAEELGTTTDNLAKMTQVQQMDYVKKYFELHKGKGVKTLSDAYMVVLYPKAVGEEENYVLFKSPNENYNLNKGLDVNKDMIITKQEAASKVRASYQIMMGEKEILS